MKEKDNAVKAEGNSTEGAVEELNWLNDYIRSQIVRGSYTEEELLDDAIVAVAEQTERPVDEIHVRNVLKSELARRQVEESEWSRPTDNDRVDSAFDLLSKHGILARQDYACCNSCGQRAIFEEIGIESVLGQTLLA